MKISHRKYHPSSFAVGAILATFLTGLPIAHALDPLPDKPPIPADNPQTAEKIALGKQLFFDKRLSLDGTVSCNSCHNVMAGGVDNLKTSIGIKAQTGGRNAPTVWNAAFLSVQFWDGRAASLEDQAKGPITNPIEMGMPSDQAAVERLQSIPGYPESFKAVFGDDKITMDRIAQAIASYERTLITPDSPFDKHLKGSKDAISGDAVKGSQLFTSLGCVACHSGANFAGPTMPVGHGFYQRFPIFADNDYTKKYDLAADNGRFDVTRKASDKHLFRVPSLRNIALTAPYFHNGSVKTLPEAIRVMAKTQLNRDLSDDEVKQLTAFLESLTGEFPKQTMPRLPQPPGKTVLP